MRQTLKLLLLLLLFSSCKKEFINNTYVRQVYSTTNYSMNDVHFPSENIGFVVGRECLILKTIDGGNSWEVISPDTGINNYSSVFFKDENTGLIIRNGSDTIFTSNGGKSWKKNANATQDSLKARYKFMHPAADKFFTDSLTGYQFNFGNLNENGMVYKTTDDGKNWSHNFTGQKNDIKDVDFVDGLHGIGIGDRTIITTSDAGNTWKIIRDEKGISPPTLNKISMVSVSLSFGISKTEIYKISNPK
ncbi:MAG: YCF48-related protein [Bacteroidetes bacterium]|nr:YCF48-related protein [Bacteroidota bacterium]